MIQTGKVSKINSALQFGFIKVAKLGDVFFSFKTQFSGVEFESLKVDDLVQISIVETERGLFAQSLALNIPSRRERSPDVGL